MRQTHPILNLVFALPLVLVCGTVLLVVLASSGESNAEVISTEAPTRTLSPQLAAIVTINAAPVRPLRVPLSSGPSEAFAALGVNPALVSAGESSFASLCAACHGPDARGMPNLGKDLVGTEYINSISNDDLLTFVKTGRPIWDAENTTGVDMPPRGGNPALSDEDIVNIIYYLRSLDPNYVPTEADIAAQESTPEPVAAQPTLSTQTEPQVASAATEPDEPAADPVSDETVTEGASDGEAVFLAACSACHGADARGLPNLGKDLVTSEFVASTSDDDLLTFVKTGRPIWDAANTTGIDMPPRGGNPALSDEDILSIIAYLRTIQE